MSSQVYGSLCYGTVVASASSRKQPIAVSLGRFRLPGAGASGNMITVRFRSKTKAWV